MDYLTTLETLYRLDLEPKEWLTEVAASTQPWLDHGLGVMAWRWEARAGQPPRFLDPVTAGASAELFELLDVEPFPAEAAHVMMQHPCHTASEQFPKEGLARKHPAWAPDCHVLIGHSPDGVGFMLGAPLPEFRSLTPKQRAPQRCVAAHMGASYRLRRAIGEAIAEPAEAEPSEAVLDPDGRCVHAEGAAKGHRARDWLRSAARALDRARGPVRREDPEEALALWQGLVTGRWSLVDQFDRDGRRFLVAIRNDPQVRDPRSLTPRERQVVAYAVLGRPNKLIAYELGLAESTVAQHLRRAIRKLGARNRVELVRMLSPASTEPSTDC